MPSTTQPAPVCEVTIKQGLEGQDDNLDLLQSYFQELKAVTVEPSPPEVDLLTFAICTHYFGVISIKPGITKQDEGDEDAEGEPEEDSFDAENDAPPPPPPSNTSISSAASFMSSHSAFGLGLKDSISKPASPEDEKVLKWREAFLAQLQEDDDEEEPLLSKGKMPERRNNQSTPDVNVPGLSTGNDLDHYINWPDDTPLDDDTLDLNAQGGNFHYCETEVYSQLNDQAQVLGREIFESEQSNSPVREMPEIPTDPNLQQFIYEEAIKYRDALRAERIRTYQNASVSRPVFIQPTKPPSTPIGLIYLASSQNADDPMHRGQLNIGIYVAPDYVEERSLVHAVKQVINEAFQDTNCHRVQAIVVDHKTKFDTLELYTSTGFSREGVGRRAFFSPVTHEWKDVFYFTILDTDWAYNNRDGVSSSVRCRPKSLWDDLLICQQREREELLRMEEKTLKRSNSTETIRDKAQPASSSIANTPRSETSSVSNSSMSAATASSTSCNQSPKRRRLLVHSDDMKKNWRSKAPSSSASSSMGTFDTMSTVSSEWEIPSRQAFVIPPSNGPSAPITPDAGPSTSSTGNWVMLDIFKKSRDVSL